MTDGKEKKRDFSIIYMETGIFVLTFLVHMFFILKLWAPQYVDEYRTFLTGEFLAGRYDLSLLHAYEEANLYYGFGQVLFYIPFFWIFRSMDAVFKAALIFNGIVMSLIPVLAARIFRMVLSEYSELQRAGLAFSVGMFSPLIYSSKTVTNETFLLFFPILMLYLLVVLLENENKKKKIVISVLLGLCSMWMYTLNARGLAITFSVFVCVAYIEIIKKERKISVFSYAAASAGVYIINYFMNKYIIRLFHRPFSGTGVRNNDINLLKRIKQLHISGFFTAVSSWSGNWFYIVIVSGGLLALLVAVVFVKQKETIERNILIYALADTIITCGMLFCVNYNTYSNPKTAKIDKYMYGRYYDLLIPVILIVGIYFLAKYADLLRTYIITMFIIVCTGVLGTVCFANILIKTGSRAIRVLNIGTLTAFLGNSFVTHPSRLHFLSVSVAILIIYTVLTILFKNKKPLIAALLFSGFFMFATSYVMASSRDTSAYNKDCLDIYRNAFSEYAELNESYKTIYFIYENGTQRGVNVQYALRDWKIAQVDIESDYNLNLDMLEKNTFILTKTEMLLDLLYEDCKFAKEENGIFIYVYGQDLIDKLNLGSESREMVSLGVLLSGSDEVTALPVVEGAQSYGPYLNLDTGTYYAEINGRNLDTVSIQVTKEGANALVESSVTEQTEKKLSIQFASDSPMENVEISIFNTGVPYVIMDDIYIYNEQGEEAFKANGNELYVTIPACYIASDEEVYLNPVLLDKGRYLIRVEGINVQYLELTSDDLPGGYLKELEDGENYVVYELNCEGFIKQPDILFESQTDIEKCIRNIFIERIDS